MRRRGSRRPSPTSGVRCCATSVDELHALPALRSTLARSFDPVGELLDTASPRLGGLRAAVRVAYDRLRRRLDALVGAELGSALQEPIVTLRNGRYVVPVKAEARVPGQGHRPRRLGQRPDPVHRAARRGRARERLARGSGGRAGGDRPDPRRAVGARRGQRRGPARDPRRAGTVRPVGGQGESRGGDGRHARRDRRSTRGRPALGAPPGPHRQRRPDRYPASATATRHSS